MGLNTIIANFKNPPQKCRSLPFWSWNDQLDPEFLRWQIREMDKAGLGGFFMHARGGLETEYLGSDWMNCIGACLEEGKKYQLNSWIYDEDGWPSGFAGGLVTVKGDRFHARGLKLEVVAESENLILNEKVLGVYSFDKGNNKIRFIGAQNVKVDPGISSGQESLIIVSHTSGPYYIDVLNPEVVKEFIRETHEKYYALFGNEFGKALQGFFTDEPRLSEGKVPWSYRLPEIFGEKYGYDLVSHLPLLFLECQGYEKVRYDFWALVNELFTTSFMKQIYDWCEEHHCKLTGHVMMEESLYSQMTGTSGSMPFYEYMHIPGMDWLRRTIGNPVVPKQVASVACQLGKEQVISESYALCGWDISFEEMKWIAEWQYVNGVNLLCQHLQGYTLRGLRKRDYPPSLFIQQPWWEEYHFFNDYLAKLGMVLSSGRSAAGVLLLHPMKSGWIAYDGENNETIRRLDQDFIWASETLSGLHIDYHYGDETILAKYAGIKQDRFVVGKCEYSVLILPSMLTLDHSTAVLLEKWLDSGGTVISIGDFPRLCSGTPAGCLDHLKSRTLQIGKDPVKLYDCLKRLSLLVISITDGRGELGEIRYLQRDLGDVQLFFLVNQDQEQAFDTTVTIRGKGILRRLLLENEAMETVASRETEDGLAADIRFLPMQSYILLLAAGTGDCPPPAKPKELELQLGNEWEIEAMDLNALTLDACSYRVDGGKWSNPAPVIQLMNILLNLKRSCQVELKFTFDADLDPDKIRELFLVLETPEIFEILFNGRPVSYRDCGWWKDSAFKKVDIKPWVKTGRNEVVLKTFFYQDPEVYEVTFGENVYETEKNKLTFNVELESIYLVGDFGVVSRSGYTCGERKALHTDGPFVMVAQPRQVMTGDLTQQGFCFFSGKLTLTQTCTVFPERGSRTVLKLKRPDAVLTKVFINDRPVQIIPWAPYSLDITEYLTPGENKLSLQLFSGNRNLLGPHHHIDGELYSVGPSSFTGKWGWTERKSEAHTILPEERVKNYWKEGYSLVRFGLRD